MKIGNPRKKNSLLGKVAGKIPRTCDINHIRAMLPANISADESVAEAVADVLENAKIISKGTRTRKQTFYKKA